MQDFKSLYQYYEHLHKKPSNINEHLPVLKKYATNNIVTEMGVRKGVSTVALLTGRPKKLTSYDIIPLKNLQIFELAKKEKVNFKFVQANVLDIEIEPTDILFIDTLHRYSQIKTELALHGSKVRKNILFHDTITFRDRPEILKTEKFVNDKGIYPAILEFLGDDWFIKEEYTNNNGLTIIERK